MFYFLLLVVLPTWSFSNEIHIYRYNLVHQEIIFNHVRSCIWFDHKNKRYINHQGDPYELIRFDINQIAENNYTDIIFRSSLTNKKVKITADVEYKRKHYMKDSRAIRQIILEQENILAKHLRSDTFQGIWYDHYTGKYFTNSNKLDIDHIVPLKNAHISGGSTWSRDKKNHLHLIQHHLGF